MAESKWQPVMLIMPQRLECNCGALAVFVALDNVEADSQKTFEYGDEVSSHETSFVLKRTEGYKEFDYGAYCQDCWQKEVVEAQDE